MTHICVSKLTIIGSDNGLSPGRHQPIIWTNTGILLIGPLGTNFSEILIKIYTFSFKKMHLKMSSGKWRPSCLGLNVLMLHCFEHPQSMTCFSAASCYSLGVTIGQPSSPLIRSGESPSQYVRLNGTTLKSEMSELCTDIGSRAWWSISHKICIWFCYTLFCCD